jgi:hypothetical protein
MPRGLFGTNSLFFKSWDIIGFSAEADELNLPFKDLALFLGSF